MAAQEKPVLLISMSFIHVHMYKLFNPQIKGNLQCAIMCHVAVPHFIDNGSQAGRSWANEIL